MNKLRKIALELRKPLKDIKIARDRELRLTLAAFFEENPNPSDDQIHALAEDMGMDHDKLEQEIYSLLGSFFSKGFYITEGEGKIFDEDELKRGIEVEMEHTDCKIISERIAKDHLTEIPDYYTRLDKMEAEAEK